MNVEHVVLRNLRLNSSKDDKNGWYVSLKVC